MVEKFIPYDPAESIDSLAAIEVFLIDAFETGDADHIAAALGDVVRAREMAAVAGESEPAGEQLYRSLGTDGGLTLTATLEILKAVGLRLTVVPALSVTEVLSSMPDMGEDADLGARKG